MACAGREPYAAPSGVSADSDMTSQDCTWLAYRRAAFLGGIGSISFSLLS